MVVIVSALRTPIGKYGGAISNVLPEELASILLQNTLSYTGMDPKLVDETIIGHTKQSAHTPNVARVAALKAGFPTSIPAYTVHRQCGSGMQAVYNSWMSILTGQTETVLAGGVESMSQAPYYYVGNRFNSKPEHFTIYDSNLESQPKSQPEDIYGRFNMIETAEHLASKYGISRYEQDEFALNSQLKAKKAIETGRFGDEIVSIEVSTRKVQKALFSRDEHPRDTDLEKLAKLKPIIGEDGTVTAGNASGLNDGAAMLMIMKEEKALSLGLKPLASIESFGVGGVHPKEMGLGPVPATKQALRNSGLEMKDIDIIELNEAFAAQSIAVLKEWGITPDDDRLNKNGGAIALGHPLGSSGARIIVTLVHEMIKSDLRYGLATLCTAGGLGISTVIKKWDT
ncbi:thiolase family protein [Ornithinibacillus halophilus]|uniref:acetyl-CoA C-acetyltransferase n=1 Tax=Ornithinibacillus halophilus TaxID=930117 RepID=A0A1M5GKG8_9BACI|nr:thiolase family protein [Ornithinibacillus halophilus]SHG04186.1 acetyl-CoA C-acetyltransferase [Ornithinibacillus halophilus]